MQFSELEGAAVGVWGAGREISSFAARLAERLPRARIEVAAFDAPPPADDARRLLQASGARVLDAAHAAAALRGCDVVVRSPGVPVRRPELQEVRAAGVEVTTPTALWLAEHGSTGVLGVTGTKGKSTTAALAHHLLCAAGERAVLAGNIGAPVLDLLLGAPAGIVVLELSSYQISDLDIGPEVALVTNLSREHVDWHGSEQAYRADKLRLLSLPGVAARVLPADRDFDVPEGAERGVRLFGGAAGAGARWRAEDGTVLCGGEALLDAAQLPLRGHHNALNLCAALTAVEALGRRAPDLPAALEGFLALPHRLEPVAERNGVTWVDDSISTTPDSALAALASYPEGELVLIAGGQDRGQDHAALAAAIVRRRARLVAVPTTGPTLLRAAREAGLADDRAFLAEDLPAAVEAARAMLGAGPGFVLLSPAAPSYDRFRDFEERGEQFAQLARRACGSGAPAR